MAVWVGSAVVLLVSWCVAIADAQPPAYFVFGDSLVDSGNNDFLATSARADRYPYGIDFPTRRPTGRFSNGYNIPDLISLRLGAEPVLPFLSPALTGTALLRGANFASAGVGILNDTGIQFVNIIRMPLQLRYFQEYQSRLAALVGTARAQRIVAGALVSITLGGNDYVNNYYLTPVSARSLEYNVPDYTRFIVSEYEKYLRQLYDLGARRILVTSVGPLGCAPAERATRTLNGACAPELQRASQLFNSDMRGVISRLNSRASAQAYTFADSFSMNMNLYTNPGQYGFSNIADACCGQGRNNGVGLCTAASNLCRNRNAYLYWDNYHPSERTCRIIVNGLFQASSELMSPLNLTSLMNLEQ